MSTATQALQLSFLRRVSRERNSAKNKISSVAEYVENTAESLSEGQLEVLLRELPLLRIQFAGISVAEFPHLPTQLKFLSDFFEDSADETFPASFAARKEVGLALRYTARNIDIIPDHVPEIGYADDSVIVRTVLKRREDVFREYCRFRKLRWSKITLKP